jgi:hypothetical protein
MNSLTPWVPYAQAAALIALAIIGALIAFRQWRTAHNALCLNPAQLRRKGNHMTSKRQEADREFLKVTRKEKVERINSKSRTITNADKTTRDLKTADLRKQREAKEAGEVVEGLKKGKR